MSTILAFDIGGTSTKWGLFDEWLELKEHGDLPTAFSRPEELVQVIVERAAGFDEPPVAVGISVPGTIDPLDATGTVRRGGALPYLNDYPLGLAVSKRLSVPVAIDNDGKCCALGEYAAGSLRHSRVGIVLAIGTGIGGGIVIGGNVLSGAHHFAGEFSFLHNDVRNPFDYHDYFCSTNGWRGLRKAYLAQIDEVLTPEEIEALDGRRLFELIDGGDVAAQAALVSYAGGFAAWLYNLQAILDPDTFAIAGGISCHDALIAEIHHAVNAQAATLRGPLAGAPIPHVVRAELGNDANLYGAALHAKRAFRGQRG